MASLAPEDKVEFLIQLLVTGEFTPNYGALAKEMGINTNNNAQRRLKGIVEADKRFVLRSSGSTASIVKASDAEATTDSGVQKGTPQSTKGRKRNKTVDEDGEGDTTPSKAAKKSRTKQVEKVSTKGTEDGSADAIQDEDTI